MSRRLIFIEDFSDEQDSAEFEQALELLQDNGFKAYPVSSIFASDEPAAQPLLSESDAFLDADNTADTGDAKAIETLLRQKTLLESEVRRFRTLIENSGELMYAIDFGGNITFISNNVIDILGYTPDELIGRNFLSLIAPAAQTNAGERFAQQMASSSVAGPFYTEIIRKDGRMIPMEINGRNFLESDIPVLNIGLARDVSQRKAMEAEVFRRNRELTVLYSIASAVNQSLDFDDLLRECLGRMLETIGVETGGILLLNPAGEFRLAARQGIDDEFQKLFQPLQSDFKLIRRIISAGEVVIIDDLQTLKQLDQEALKHTNYNSFVLGPLRANDRILGGFILASKGTYHFSQKDRELILSIGNQVGLALQSARFYDQLNQTVQELRQSNTQLEEATKHKSEFLANMSHELRTPLNAIIGFSELLVDQSFGPLNDKQKRYVENIFNSGKHLLALVNDVLDLAKVEAGKMELKLEELRLPDVINDVVTNIAPLALKKNLALATGLNDPDSPHAIKVTADRGRLRQIIQNLLSNAIKFTPEGGLIQINSVLVRRQGATWLELSVSDNGIGIKPEDLERIFAEFQMVDSTLARKQQGTGLGLALSRQLAHLHNGELSVKSVFGKGSIFTLTMPVEPLKKEEPPILLPFTASHVHHHSASPAPQEEVAMVVEDEDPSAELLQLYMEQAGYRVVRCANGGQALEMAREIHPAVITLDIMLPNKNGWEILSDLKNDPVTRDIPVLIISMLDNYDSSFTLGAVACFVKPVRRQELLSKLDELQIAASHKRRQQHFEQHQQSGEPLHALVIDDNEHDRELISSVLSGAGMEVETAESGETGWETARKNPPDLVVLDLMLPDTDGIQVLKRLRQNLDTLDVPIFIFTAKDLDALERSQLKQVDAVLQKGNFSSQTLLNAVNELAGTFKTENRN